MKVGAIYPQNEMHGDPAALHDIGLAVEGLGYDSLLFFDHVVGADRVNREPPLWGPYDETDSFHDPFVAFGYLAAITSRIELATGVLILPQRQTVLVAQQAADADLMSGGRLRLGVGTGWNWVEYDALNEEFATRGPRLDEQITLLRELWEKPIVSFKGDFHELERCCINPRPARAIPIWIGGFSEPAFRRCARFGDGFTFAADFDDCLDGMARVRELLVENRRGESAFGFEVTLNRARDVESVVALAGRWQEAGGTGVSVYSEKVGLDSIAGHIAYLDTVKAALQSELGS